MCGDQLSITSYDGVGSEQRPPMILSETAAWLFCMFRQGIAMGEGSLSDMYRLDTATAGKAKWTKVSMKGDVPEARSYHAMTAVGTTLYVFGGCTTEGRLNDLHSFDTNTGVWQKMPKSDDILGRGGAGLVSIGAKLYVVGGFAGKEMGDVHEFDTDGREWRQLAQPLPPRSVFGVVALDKRIVVIGGEVDPSSEGHAGAGHFSQDVYVLDTADEEGGWVKATVAGEAEAQWSARGWFPAAAYGDNTIAVFGGNALDNSRLDDCFLLCMDKQLKH